MFSNIDYEYERETIIRQVKDERIVERIKSLIVREKEIRTQLSVIRRIIDENSIFSDEENNSLMSIYGKLSMRRDVALKEIMESGKC
jgi:hypothetical protein